MNLNMAKLDKSRMKANLHRSLMVTCLIAILIRSNVPRNYEKEESRIELNDLRVQARRKLQDNEDFLARHKRTPRDRNGIKMVGLDNYCKPGSDGLYGEMSSSVADVSYFYEMEIQKSDMMDSMQIAVQAVERRINDDLANLFFPSCKNRGRNLRGSHSRKLLVEGLTPIPVDVSARTLICQNGEVPIDSECSLVTGGLTIYFDGDTDDLERQNTLMQVQSFIQEKINRNTYSTTFEGIRRITYIPPSDSNPFVPNIQEDLIIDSNEDTLEQIDRPIDSFPDIEAEEVEEEDVGMFHTGHHLNVWSSALIAIAGTAIPLGIVHMWKRRREQRTNRSHQSNGTAYSVLDSTTSFQYPNSHDQSINADLNKVSKSSLSGSQESSPEAPIILHSESKHTSRYLQLNDEIIGNEKNDSQMSPKQHHKKKEKGDRKNRELSLKVGMIDDDDDEVEVKLFTDEEDIPDLDKSKKSSKKDRKERRKQKSRKKPKASRKESKLKNNAKYREQQRKSNQFIYQYDLEKKKNGTESDSSGNDSDYSLDDGEEPRKASLKHQNLLDDFYSVGSPELLDSSTQLSPESSLPFQSHVRRKRAMSAIEEVSSTASTRDRSTKEQSDDAKYLRSNVYSN